MGVLPSELPKKTQTLSLENKEPIKSFFDHAELENTTPENQKEKLLGCSAAQIS